MKLAFPPSQPSYSAQFPGARSAILQGPASRFAKDYERNSIQTSCQFQIDDYGFQYLRSFFKLNRYGTFRLDLILDDNALAEYTAKFISFKLASMLGNKYTVACGLEVAPLLIDDAADAAAFAAYQAAYSS